MLSLVGKNLLARVPAARTITSKVGLVRSYSTQQHSAEMLRLIDGYRFHGHLKATVDPLQAMQRSTSKLLSPAHHGLDESEVASELARLERLYCGDASVQFAHIESDEEREWLYAEHERIQDEQFNAQQQVHILKQLIKSEVFDHYMQKKFPTTKRYGLEGNESMMVACDAVFAEAARGGVENVVIGMPHRGRLNLLVQMLKYRGQDLFWKVKGNSELPEGVIGIGDVLSHIGVSSDIEVADGKKLHVSLIQNPSHLEAADPTAVGKARAKQFYSGDVAREKTFCLQLHGDAAFSGQGVVTETLSLSQLPGFNAGGSVHIVVNNQLGFTTIPKNGRSTRYSSDVGKFVGCPIVLVNSQNPEQVERMCRLATSYRQHFKKDIIVDLIGWRKYGHNEVDEPSFTQPTMYSNIRKRKSIPQLYAAKLQESGVFTAEQLAEFVAEEQRLLDVQLQACNEGYVVPPADHLRDAWAGLEQSTRIQAPPATGYAPTELIDLANQSVVVPSDFTMHQRLQRSFANARVDKAKLGQADWATAEAVAIAALMREGFNVRISGQDVGRGTFSQRHWELYEQSSDRVYSPLKHLPNTTGQLEVVNSNLSEFAVLSYEYGYSLESPKTLAIWEAQFGDFFNGAQIVFDQFIASGEVKWLRQTSLVVLLPHGFDGAGPEHSSCKMERFLQLCDTEAVHVRDDAKLSKETNMYVVNPSTPANYFHVLRRQMHRNFRKPLIVVGPKVLLRHPLCTSTFDEMAPGTKFQEVLADPDTIANPSVIEKVIFCSGKIFYDLQEERTKNGVTNTAIVRLEELSPFPYAGVEAELNRYTNAKQFVWCQEEQQNAGAWSFVEPRFKRWDKTTNIKYVGREPLAASAIGISALHKKEVAQLLKDAFSN
eukprot:gene3618-4146_t